MIITNKINMDLRRPQSIPVVSAVQTDSYSRNLELCLYDNAQRFPIPEDAAVMIRYKKFDGKGGEYDTLPDGTCAWHGNGNTLTVALAPQVLTAPGIVEVSVSLLAHGKQLSTFPIQIDVKPIARAEIAQSENYFYVTRLLSSPADAEVGQFLQVAAVDGCGKVTGLNAVDVDTDIAGAAAAAVEDHNHSTASHTDIRDRLELLSADMIPDYVAAEAEAVMDRVMAVQGPHTFTFAALSDLHFGNDGYTDGIKHACQALRYIDNRMKLDAVAVLGDYTDGSPELDEQNAFDDMKAVNSLLQMLRFAPNLRQQGNHDYNVANPSVTHRFIQAHSEDVVWGSKAGGYYYRDFDAYKLRIISLNTTEEATDFVRCSAAQYNWFVNALDLSDKEDAGQWQTLILSHHPLDWYVKSEYVFCYILDAYKNGTAWANSDGSIVCDFSGGKNAAVLIGNIHGHIHNLKTDCLHFGNVNGGNKSNIYRMSTPEACINRENQYPGPYQEETAYPKTVNGPKDTAFVVYCLDLDAYTLHAICYGAGYDRVLTYTNSFPVVNSLTHVTTDNPLTSAVMGGAYSALLEAEDGYKIDSISVTMDGVDITASAVNGSEIRIGAVTGEVKITATAVIQVVNLIDTVGYQNDARISTTSGELREKTGYVTSGEIQLEAEGDVYRTAGVNFNADMEYDRGICVYQPTENATDFSYWMFLNSYASKSPLVMSGNVGTVEVDTDGNLVITTGSGWCSQISGVGSVGRKIRLVGSGSGDDLIVTKNQEIVSVG